MESVYSVSLLKSIFKLPRWSSLVSPTERSIEYIYYTSFEVQEDSS